ncbi:MAG: YybH family protein [Bacteroidia bacterium]
MKLLALFIFAIALSSCNCPVPSASDLAKDREAIIQTDKDFNDCCSKYGQATAFTLYADSSLIAMGEGTFPIIGITALKESYIKRHDTTSKLTWVPEKAEASGNLGYTFGWWKFYTKTKNGIDTIYQGDYVTVWKKQKDSSWKYVLDGGNDTPARK